MIRIIINIIILIIINITSVPYVYTKLTVYTKTCIKNMMIFSQIEFYEYMFATYQNKFVLNLSFYELQHNT